MEKIALITGSSRGIGRAIAALLARSGWAVCINYRERHDCAEELAAQLTAEGCRVMVCQADVSDREAVTRRVPYRFGSGKHNRTRSRALQNRPDAVMV